MVLSLRTWRDRTGHGVLPVVLLLLGATAVHAAPGNYKARRFDVVVRAADGGLDVTESITFEFQSGTFTKVWREISTSRTDGIQILGAAMDGAVLTQGDGPGHYAVSGRNKIRVEWRFAETPASVHRFDVHYLARGVIYRDGGSDVLRWQALPSEHRYRIDASRIQFEPADARAMPPEKHRVALVSLRSSNESVTIDASAVQSNGWITAELRYPAGALVQAEPAWRTRAAGARALAPRWAMGGAALFIVGLLIAVAARQGYASPDSFPTETTATEPPQPLPAALAAVLAGRGRVNGYQGMAAILDLADRGVLTVREGPGVLGIRNYELSQVPGRHDLAAHEAEAIAMAFGGRGDDVSISRARGRLARQGRRFSAAVNADLAEHGLIDPARKAVRDRLTVIAFAMLLVGVLGMVAAAPSIPRFDGWPFLVPAGLMVAGIVAIIMAASATSLSDAGLIEAARWRGFKQHLRALASAGDERGGAAVPSRWIVYAIAFGLGYYWSRYLKRYPAFAPHWFVSAGADPGIAFATFVGSHGTSASSGGGAAGAAAGGGGSGAG